MNLLFWIFLDFFILDFWNFLTAKPLIVLKSPKQPGASRVHAVDIGLVVHLNLFSLQLEGSGNETCVGCPQLRAQFDALRDLKARQLACNMATSV